MGTEVCPGCGESVVGGKIPYEIVENYIPLEWAGNKDAWLAQNPWPTWKKKVGIEVRGAYDGVLIWHHEDCGHYWPRFSADDWERLHNRAVEIIEVWQAKNGN